jgi:hypothetical protein
MPGLCSLFVLMGRSCYAPCYGTQVSYLTHNACSRKLIVILCDHWRQLLTSQTSSMITTACS